MSNGEMHLPVMAGLEYISTTTTFEPHVEKENLMSKKDMKVTYSKLKRTNDNDLI